MGGRRCSEKIPVASLIESHLLQLHRAIRDGEYIASAGDPESSMRRLELSPFIAYKDHIRGFVYDVFTGLLDEVGRDD